MRLSHSLLPRKYRNTRGKVLLKHLSRVPTWRHVNAKWNRDAKTLNRRRISIAASRHIRRAHSAGAFRDLFPTPQPVTDHKSLRYRRVALLSGTLLNAATVNVRLCGIPEPVRYPDLTKDAADDQCGSIVASGLPWPDCIASIRLLRIEPSIAATLQIATLAGALLPPAIGMRVHNDPIVSQHSGDYLTTTRDKAPRVTATTSAIGVLQDWKR